MHVVQSSLSVASQPRAEGPELVGGDWTFQCLGLKLNGAVRLGDKPAPDPATIALPASKSPVGMGWRMGWVQVNVQEWYWALYRKPDGQSATLLRWPTYTALDNQDRDGRDIFYAIKAPFYRQLEGSDPSGSIEFVDMPIAKFKPKLAMAGGEAPLSHIGVRLSFVCALAARGPDDALYVLKWVPWFVQWSCDFVAGRGTQVAKKQTMGTKALAGAEQSGIPTVLKQALGSATGSTANVLANAAPTTTVLAGPAIEQELRRLRAKG